MISDKTIITVFGVFVLSIIANIILTVWVYRQYDKIDLYEQHEAVTSNNLLMAGRSIRHLQQTNAILINQVDADTALLHRYERTIKQMGAAYYKERRGQAGQDNLILNGLESLTH